MKLDIVINTDDKYLQHAMAMLCSLYESNIMHTITSHVLHKDLSKESKKYITELSTRYKNKAVFYDINDAILEGVQFRKNRPLSKAAYYRLLLSSILPADMEKVLYLDCDMIVMRDIQEIFNIEIDNYALAATLDNFPKSEKHRLQLHMEVGERTFCSGIMLVNLKYWRDNKVEAGLIKYAKRYREVVYFHDQDVLNYYFKKKWFLLPPKWNHTVGTLRIAKGTTYKDFDLMAYAKSPMVYHYASIGIKPWYDTPAPEKQLYIKFLKLSQYPKVVFDKKPIVTHLKLTFITFKYNIKKIIQKAIFSCSYTASIGQGIFW